MQFVWLILTVFSIWLIALSIFFWKLSSHYNSLTKGITKKTLQALLDILLKDVDITKEDIARLQKRCDTIEKENKFHIQKVGLLRFNPFKDTGGDQSFILTFVDGNDSGIIISGLHSRSDIRWYAKRVENGRGLEHELSEEEQKALKEVKPITENKK
jgi:hypothetical protein